MSPRLSVRLMVAMVGIPVLGLVSVGIAMTLTTRDKLDDRLKFTVVPVTRSGTGLRGTAPDDEFQVGVVESADAGSPGSQQIIFEPETGEAYLLEAPPDFIAAYKHDRSETISSLNRQLGIAVAAVSVVAVGTAVWLSRRIVRPVLELTDAARKLEAGDLHQRVGLDMNDEIGELGHAFNAMAESLERNETLRKTMTSDIAHELRTPLNNVNGYLDAIVDGVVEPTPATVASLQEEVGLLVRLVEDLQVLALADAGHQHLVMSDCPLMALVDRTVEMARARAAAKGISMALRASAQPVVHGDPSRLGQVMTNLLENAIRHTPPGGSITVEVDEDGDGAAVTVDDTGPGIPVEHLPFIFERFYRADPSRARATGGVGLGLAIVKQLVEAHGGSVTASGNDSGGARFIVRLPASLDEAPQRRRRHADVAAPASATN